MVRSIIMAWLWTLALVAAARGRRCCLGSAALLVCCSVGSSSQLLLTHASLVHSPVKLALGAEASTTPPLFFPYIWNEKCSWAPFLLMALNCLGYFPSFPKTSCCATQKMKKGQIRAAMSGCGREIHNVFELSFSQKIWMNCQLKQKCEGPQWSTCDDY